MRTESRGGQRRSAVTKIVRACATTWLIEPTRVAKRLLPGRLPIRTAKSTCSSVMLMMRSVKNCPQHIPQRFEAADVAALLAGRDERIVTLEAEIKRLNRSSLPF